MQTIKQLQDRVAVRARAARHLLADKGDRQWTPNDQAAFDALLEDADQAEAMLQARRALDTSSPMQWAQQRQGLELYLRAHFEGLPADAKVKIRNAMSTTTGSQGGFAVGSFVAAELVSLLKGYGWMRQVARQITTSTGSDMPFPTSDGTAEKGEVVAQNAAAASADMSFNTRPMTPAKFSSRLFTVPVELMMDSAVDIVAEVAQRAIERVGRIQNEKFTIGTGSGEPTGMVTAAAVGKLGVTGQTTTILYDDLVDLADSVDEGHLGMPSVDGALQQQAPGWMLSQATRKVVRKLKDTAGRPIWLPAVGGELPQLLDYPVYINNDMPAPAANAKSVAFGNLSSYSIRDVAEMIILRLDDSAFVQAGQIGFIGFMRSGGNLLDVGAVKVYQHSAT